MGGVGGGGWWWVVARFMIACFFLVKVAYFEFSFKTHFYVQLKLCFLAIETEKIKSCSSERKVNILFLSFYLASDEMAETLAVFFNKP